MVAGLCGVVLMTAPFSSPTDAISRPHVIYAVRSPFLRPLLAGFRRRETIAMSRARSKYRRIFVRRLAACLFERECQSIFARNRDSATSHLQN
jgi:hypothetical protein